MKLKKYYTSYIAIKLINNTITLLTKLRDKIVDFNAKRYLRRKYLRQLSHLLNNTQ